MMETVVKRKYKLSDVVGAIKQLTVAGSNNPAIQEVSQELQGLPVPIQLRQAFDYAYNIADYTETPPDRQQLRTVENILKSRRANCTGYVTIIGAILNNLNIPYSVRLGNYGNGYEHIYIITNTSPQYVLDCVIGQKENLKPINGKFNEEIPYLRKKDYKMLTVLNGRRTRVNGFFDDIANLLGDECKRGCDLNYMGSSEPRAMCKQACEYGKTIPQFKSWWLAYGNLPYQTRAEEFQKWLSPVRPSGGSGIDLTVAEQCQQMYPNNPQAYLRCVQESYGGQATNYTPYIIGAIGLGALYFLTKK